MSAPDEATATRTPSGAPWEPLDEAGLTRSPGERAEPEHGALPVVLTGDAPRGRHAGPRERHLEVVVHPDAATLAEATAARLLVRLIDLQSLRSPLHLVLTGGTVGIATLRAVAASPVREAVDWSGVHIWWGDERFVPADSPDRNERQARDALLDALPLPPANIHAVPAEGTAPDEDAAAVAYAHELAQFSAMDDEVDEISPSGGVAPSRHEDTAPGSGEPAGTFSATAPGSAGLTARRGAAPGASPAVPEFDVLLLGMGADGHVASLFPGHATLHEDVRTVVGEHDSPKPPPRRVSLTHPAIRAAREVWLVAAGEEKSEAVARALSGAATDEIPAAAVHGSERTLWLLDLAAARGIPA